MDFLIVIPIALFLDRLLGEPSRFHPLVGFGRLADWIESKMNHARSPFSLGVVAWLLLVLPITLIIYWLDKGLDGGWLGALCGWLAIGWKSLREHGMAVLQALGENNLEEARLKTSYLVSRDTSDLEAADLSRATIESILENGSDAIFAPLFWLIILGAPGVVFYRLSNTLDAMWGYHNTRFEQFGKLTARVDDVLNYVPARITALLYMLCGNRKLALHAWKTQGKNWYSPNAGVVMASGAGALMLKLGGNAIYHGKIKQRPELGTGNPPDSKDIYLALRLIDRSVYVILGLVLLSIVLSR
jgi:adenosylcobinamide-phosphate synthase